MNISDRNFAEDMMYMREMMGLGDRTNVNLKIFRSAEFDKIDIENLDLTPRSSNVLRRFNINNMKGILDKFDDLGKLRNCGAKSVSEIKTKFLQFWYERLTEDEVKDFWLIFGKENIIN